MASIQSSGPVINAVVVYCDAPVNGSTDIRLKDRPAFLLGQVRVMDSDGNKIYVPLLPDAESNCSWFSLPDQAPTAIPRVDSLPGIAPFWESSLTGKANSPNSPNELTGDVIFEVPLKGLRNLALRAVWMNQRKIVPVWESIDSLHEKRTTNTREVPVFKVFGVIRNSLPELPAGFSYE